MTLKNELGIRKTSKFSHLEQVIVSYITATELNTYRACTSYGDKVSFLAYLFGVYDNVTINKPSQRVGATAVSDYEAVVMYETMNEIIRELALDNNW
eukprot:CAMPEP_0182424362 /NCGR_PEP_ID=MMETSP1167-20130531/10574_1 /TAXON_ID=2988 /ORGANISM="Mallomonas Sp, Strain CCMP3275" /LENGTH=96 /DNA_ID=CAMNT_0024604127 /DNA_START=151 /DNA_END=438 /DNA_ORIENTATION=+